MTGWIKLYRKITENPLYFSEPFTRLQAWIDLLIMANYEESIIYVRGNKVEIKRGQLAKSQDTLAERWRWSRGKVLRFLDELQKAGQIGQQKSNVINIISIVNFDLYQQDSTTDGTADDTTEKNGTTEIPLSDGNNGTTENTTKTIEVQYDNTSAHTRSVQQEEQQKDQQTVQQIGQPYKEDKEVKNNSSNQRLESGQSPLPASSDEETASKQDKPKTEKLPFKEIKEMWNETCPGFPKLFTISENRKNKIRLRIAEMGGAEKALPLLKQIFTKMQESNFLKGDNKRGWKASFDWLFENDKNWVKVYEGNYDNKPERQSPTRYSNNKKCNDEWM